MSIDREKEISFHQHGTLEGVTKWINSHDEGLSEWLKNIRRAYQIDRLNVPEEDRIALILLMDGSSTKPARIGVLDVGGMTIEDLELWKTWMDPTASSRNSNSVEEVTQGNGGKAYMYKMFKGPARLLGLSERTRNCMGFEGPSGSLERGTPGFIPSKIEGREVRDVNWKVELNIALRSFGVDFDDLPDKVKNSLLRRERFTLVEGEDPLNLYRGRIDADDLLQKLSRHEQATLVFEQTQIYAIHNGVSVNAGKALALEEIAPYPALEGPFLFEIPEELPTESGGNQSTTQGSTKALGRLILYTSKDNMQLRHKILRPRWRLSYQAGKQMLGAKAISELTPATPGAEFVYGRIELEALAPYADLGRRRPTDGPLIQAVDLFAVEKIKELAKEINEKRRHKQDTAELDLVQKENAMLNKFKNKFITDDSFSGGDGNIGDSVKGPRKRRGGPPPEYGKVPAVIELDLPGDGKLKLGLGVAIHLPSILNVHVRDEMGRIVPGADLEWIPENEQICRIENNNLIARRKGSTSIVANVIGTTIVSQRVTVDVWQIDHVLLTPRSVEVPLGNKATLTAEVTNDQGERAIDVFLQWSHDADDQLILRISPTGTVAGNRLGRTSVTAGGEGPNGEKVFARVRVEVTVIPNPEMPKQGNGFPQLKLTDRDIDPETGEIRKGTPDQPVLWQEVWDYQNRIWWLNLQSEDAAYAFSKRTEDPKFWRLFHAQQLVEMVIQVNMQQEYTARGDEEIRDLWLVHKQAKERHEINMKQAMWLELQKYVEEGADLQ